MYVPRVNLLTISVMTVPRPVMVSTVLTGNFIKIAASTVAGNMVSTCCRPSRTI